MYSTIEEKTQATTGNRELKTNLDIYHRLHELGFNLIPMHKKKPLAKWATFQKRKVSDAQLQHWLTNPYEISPLEFALVTGAGETPVIVIDADDEESSELIRGKCPSTLEVKTTRGFHFYFKWDNKTGCPIVDNKSLGYDDCRISIKGFGGYVRSPSIIRCANMPLTKETFSNLPAFDATWLPLIANKTVESHHDYTGFDDNENAISQAREFLAAQKPTQAGSNASNRMLALAGVIRHGFNLSQAVTIELLLEYGERGMDENGVSYPWNYKEIQHKVNDCSYDGKIGDQITYSAEYITTLISPYPEFTNPENVVPESEPSIQTPEQPKNSKTIDYRGIFDLVKIAETQKEDWLIENWLEFGSLGMLTGDPFSGKSSIVTEIISSIARSTPFGEQFLPRCPILSIDLENRERIQVKRLARATENNLESLKGIFSSVYLPEDYLPLDAGRVEWLIDKWKTFQNGAKPFVIIDTFRSAFDASEMDVDQVKKLLYPLQRVAQRQEAAILILHHRPKNGARYSGQSSIPGALDYMWCWDSDIETREGKLSLEGTRGDLSPPMHFVLDDNQRNVYVSQEANEDTVDDYLRTALKNGGLSQTDLVKKLQNIWKGKAPGINKLRTAIDSRVGSLLLKDGFAGKYTYQLL